MNALTPFEPKAKYIPKHVKHEENLQRTLCQYIRMQYPNVLFKSDYAAGLKLTMNQARIQSSLQSGSGFPDLMIFYPSRGYHGLFIEIKTEHVRIYNTIGPRKGMISSDPHIQQQALMLKQLNKLGYFARFGRGFDKCQTIIDWYMNPNYKKQENLEFIFDA